MKRILPAILAIAAIASCSKSEVTDINTDNPNAIKFDTYTNKVTKAADVITAADLQAAGGFYVYFTIHAAAFSASTAIAPEMTKLPVTSVDAGVNWTYPGIHYWPAGQKESFFAYDNANDVNLTWTPSWTKGAPTFSYICAATGGAQKDLLVSSAIDRTNSAALTFKHALSRINFAAKSDLPGTYAKITSITLTGVKTTATYTYSTLNNGAGTWSAPVTEMAGLVYPIDATTQIAYSADTYEKTFQGANASLMLIPISVSDVTLTVIYNLYSTVGDALIDGPVTKTATIGGWVIGTNYLYNLNLTASGSLTPIVFSVTVDTWGAETESGPSLN